MTLIPAGYFDAARKAVNRHRIYADGFNHYDEGWNACVEGKPYGNWSISWRDGWRDAFGSNATEKMS